MLCVCLFVCVAAPYKQGRGSFCHVTVVSIATFVSAAPARVVLPPIVSFPDPFCARARNLKLGGGERPGKGSGKSSKPSTATGM